jgi:hypothetical protein
MVLLATLHHLVVVASLLQMNHMNFLEIMILRLCLLCMSFDLSNFSTIALHCVFKENFHPLKSCVMDFLFSVNKLNELIMCL